MPVPAKPPGSRAKWVIFSLLLVLLLLGGAFGIVYAFFWDDLTSPRPSQPVVVVTPTPTPEPYRGPKIEMVEVPAGTFTMGAPSSEPESYVDEAPARAVTISHNYYIGKYELTQSEWQAVMGSNPSHFTDCSSCPVDSVSYNDIQVFIMKLNTMGGPLVYRLPTEAEWERACRAGTDTPFSFGSTITADQANFKADEPYGTADKGIYREKPLPVGTLVPNAWGIYDMHGNTTEWVADWYDAEYYKSAPTTDPTGPATGTQRVFRGGSWHDAGKYIRSAYRNKDNPEKKFNNCGFRLAATKKSS